MTAVAQLAVVLDDAPPKPKVVIGSPAGDRHDDLAERRAERQLVGSCAYYRPEDDWVQRCRSYFMHEGWTTLLPDYKARLDGRLPSTPGHRRRLMKRQRRTLQAAARIKRHPQTDAPLSTSEVDAEAPDAQQHLAAVGAHADGDLR